MREVHDHRSGPCDLPDYDDWLVELRSVRQPHLLGFRYRCVWDLEPAAYESICGCSACTGSFDRRASRRGERRAAAAEVRSQLSEASGADDDRVRS